MKKSYKPINRNIEIKVDSFEGEYAINFIFLSWGIDDYIYFFLVNKRVVFSRISDVIWLSPPDDVRSGIIKWVSSVWTIVIKFVSAIGEWKRRHRSALSCSDNENDPRKRRTHRWKCRSGTTYLVSTTSITPGTSLNDIINAQKGGQCSHVTFGMSVKNCDTLSFKLLHEKF